MAKRKAKKTRPDSPPEAPTCHCLLLLDEVFIGVAREKHVLHGVIGTVALHNFPTRWGGAVVYARMSNIYGEQAVRIVVQRADGDGPTIRTTATLRAPEGPLGVRTLVSPIPVFEVPGPARYVLQAECGGTILATTPFQIVDADGVAREQGHGNPELRKPS